MRKITTIELIEKIQEIRTCIIHNRERFQTETFPVHPNYTYAAKNLVDYLSLRTFDIRIKQGNLSFLGLSSFSNSERYVLTNIDNILYHLKTIQGQSVEGLSNPEESTWNFFTTLDLLDQNTNRLFGESNNQISTRIMVTLPSEAAGDAKYIADLLINGMEIARINCSHDIPEVWKSMIDTIHIAEKQTGKLCKIYMDLSGPKIRSEKIHQLKKKKNNKNQVVLHIGDRIKLYSTEAELKDAIEKKEPSKTYAALVSMSIPNVVESLTVGHRIWFDDGKIGGVIEDISAKNATVLITKAGSKGTKLKEEKGINLPDTHLQLPSLTEEDVNNLPFIAKHADIVGYSFVRTANDVTQLMDALSNLNRMDIGVVLKIENKESFNNLPDLLLTAMKWSNIGVMIARGDLAVELGIERISEVQEQILWVCEAAHVPAIWATQILENLAQTGLATRAEITDASMSVRAECVMLNKGPHIMEAITTLLNILRRMEAHQNKKQGTLRQLSFANEFFNKDIQRFN
ncbi:MAG: pyruvate kinase [Prolixibacteraceae bacterium]|nr:pyruvate kinase [Prolixibacteraceae bacterium]